MEDIRSDMVHRVIVKSRMDMERFAGEVIRNIISGIESDIDLLKGIYDPDFSMHRESYDTHRSESYMDSIGEMFYTLLNKSFKPKANRKELKGKYMGRKDMEDALDNAYKIFKKYMDEDFLKEIKSRINQIYSPIEYKLYKAITKEGKNGKEYGEWNLVDTIVSKEGMKRSDEDIKNRFIKKFKDEGIETRDLEDNFDNKYMIKSERKDPFADLPIKLSAGLSDDATDDLINRMLGYYLEHPDQFDKVLVQSVLPSESKIKTKEKPVKPGGKGKKKEKVYKQEEEDVSEGEKGGTLGLAWFRPLPEGKNVEEQEMRGLTPRRENIDKDVLEYMRGMGEFGKGIPWEYEGVGVITGKDPTVKYEYESESAEMTPVLWMNFKLPEYKDGDRVFRMAIPGNLSSGIRDANKGEEYTFNYKGYSPYKGILLQFNEQADSKKTAILKEIEEEGIPAGKIKKVLPKMVHLYLVDMAQRGEKGLSDILQDFYGLVTLGGKRVNDIDELDEMMDDYIEEENRATRSTDYVKRMIEERGKEEELSKSIKEEYGPETSKLLAKGDDIRGRINHIAHMISREFPSHAEFSNIKDVGLTKAFLTAPTIEWMIRSILDKTLMPMASEGKVPWTEFTEELIKSNIMMDPMEMKKYYGGSDFEDFMTAISIVKAKNSGMPNDQVMELVNNYRDGKYKASLSEYPDIVKFLRTYPSTSLTYQFKDIKKRIQQVLLDMYKRGDEVVRKIFSADPKLETSLRGISKGVGEKQVGYEEKAKQLEQMLLNRDFSGANELLKEVGIKAGTPLKELNGASYSVGGADIDDKSSRIISGIVEKYREKVESVLEKGYSEEVGKMVRQRTKDAIEDIYRNFNNKDIYPREMIASIIHYSMSRVA